MSERRRRSRADQIAARDRREVPHSARGISQTRRTRRLPQAGQPRGHAHYGHVSAAAVNIRAIDQYFAAGPAVPGLRLLAPERDGARGQASRLLVRR